MLTKPDRDEEAGAHVNGKMDQVKPSSPKNRDQKMKIRCLETIQELSEDPELAEVRVKAYVQLNSVLFI